MIPISVLMSIEREVKSSLVAVDAEISGLKFGWQTELLPESRETVLSLKGPSLSTLSPVAEVALPDWAAHGNGGLDFAAWPEEFESGVIDLWAVVEGSRADTHLWMEVLSGHGRGPALTTGTPCCWGESSGTRRGRN